MTPGASDLIRTQYDNLPGAAVIEGFGHKLLAIGFLFSFSVEIYRGITQGRCNLLAPLVRVVAAGLLLTSLAEVGALFNALSRELASGIGDATGPALFAETWGVTVKATSKLGLFGTWCFKVFFGFISMGIYLVMYGLKFLMLDCLQPLRFSMTLFLGFIAIPLGVWPKLGTFGIWFRQLAQISLWPLIFQFLLALSTSAFTSIFKEVRKLDLAAAVTGLFDDTHGVDGSLMLIFKFLLLCCGYIYMTGQIPRLAAGIVHSHAVDAIGGMMAAKASDLSAAVGQRASQGPLAALAPFIGGGSAGRDGADGDGSDSGDGNLGTVTNTGEEARANSDGGLNARRNEPPPIEVGA